MQPYRFRQRLRGLYASARLALALALVAGLCGMGRAVAEGPAVVTVNTVADENDGCAVGDCSLREAIAAVDDGGTIGFSLPADATIVLSDTLGALAIARDLTIDGSTAEGLTISGGDEVRVFAVGEGASVTLRGLTVTAGAGADGGGISNRGELTLTRVAVRGNSAETGAGILNWGALTVEQSAIRGNSATAYGGGILNNGTLTVRESTIDGNSAAWGGGLASAGTATLERSTVSGNTALELAGGLLVSGNALAQACLFSGNTAPYGGAAYSAGVLRLVATTLSGNQAATAGGGLYSFGASALLNATVTANQAGAGGGIYAGAGAVPDAVRALVAQAGGDGASVRAAPQVSLRNTLLAGNSAGRGRDASGALHSLGYNLLGATSGYEVGGDTAGNITTGEDLHLGPLTGNGGPTATHALLRGSPAIDAGSCEDDGGNALGSDQRGISRPQGAGCDIGAFEAGVPWLDLNGPAGGADAAASWIEDGGPVAVAPQATLSDADSTLAWVKITLAERPDGGKESLAADTSGTGLSASYDGDAGILTLSGDDSLANYQQVLQRVTYSNISQDPEPETRTLHFTLNDGSYPGNTPTATVAVTPLNDVPAPSAGGPYAVTEGGSLTLHGSATDPDSDTLTYAWDLDGDGSFEVSGQDAVFTAAGRDGPANQAVTLRVCDEQGECGGDSIVVSIANAAPEVSLPGEAAIDESTDYSSAGIFADPGPDTWTATVDYGDGGGAEVLALDGKAFALSHTYALQGGYTVTVAVSDDDGGTGQATCRVSVRNVAPQVGAAADQYAREAEGHTFSLGSFTDLGSDGLWTVAVDWGDGSADDTFRAAVPGELMNRGHTYVDDGRHTVTVRVTDKDGDTGSATFEARVANRAPSVRIHAQTQTDPSGMMVGLATSVSDPSMADRHAGFRYAWRLTRDGRQVATSDSAFFGFHIAADAPGAYTARVEVSDKDGGRASDSWHTVVRPPLDASIRIVWPHGNAPVRFASLANISAWLLQRGATTPADLNGWAPEVYLWQAVNNEPAQVVARGSRRAAEGREAALYDFNNIDVSAAQDPANRVYFYLTLDGTAGRSNVWAHAADGRTYHPTQDVPTGVGAVETAVDARIEVLWPHDGAPASQATAANLTAALFRPGTLDSAPPDWEPTVRLWRALNNGVAEEVALGAKRIVTQNGLTYPLWDFNNVDVSAARDSRNKHYFFLTVDGVDTHSSIWVHGADARTLFPHWDLPLLNGF